MESVLAPELAPITFTVGFLASPLPEVTAAVTAWYAEQRIRRTVKPAARQPLSAALASLLPLRAPDFARLWIATRSPRWPTAYFDGFINGTDAFPPVSYLAERLGCQGLVASRQPDLPSSCYGARRLTMYGPAPTEWLNVEWSVSLMNDGGRWEFQRSGAMQPFEEPGAYTRKGVRDRLPADLFARYCHALELPLRESDYGPESVLDTPAKRWFARQRTESLAVARARLGLAIDR